MMKIKQLLIVILTVLTYNSWSQTETKDLLYEYAGGKKYIVHVAAPGNTLWGLHTTYQVPVNDIVAKNPGVEKGLKEGYKYMIPVGVAEINVPDGTQMREHEVQKGETAFSIAKKYNTSVDNLLRFNAGIDTGLKIGQVLKVVSSPANDAPTPTTNGKPLPTVVFSDSILSYTVKELETMYSISKRFMVPVNDLMAFNNLKSTAIKPGDVLKIPLKKESIKQAEVREVKIVDPPIRKVDETLLFPKKTSYNIAVLLTFNLNDLSGSALQNLATEFYMGLELAIDSLEREGFKAMVKVIDIPLDSVGIMKKLNAAEMKTMDLIFAPLLPASADIVGRWAKKMKIRTVCPSACNSALLLNNPFVYSSIASDITQMELLAKYTMQQYKNAEVVLVKPDNVKDHELYNAFRRRFIELAKTNGNKKVIEATPANFTTFIHKSGETVLIYPARDKGATLTFINNLHKSAGKYAEANISVLGMKDWAGFDELSGYYKTKYKVSWASTNDINYKLPETQVLLRLFRTKYKVDLSKVSAHAFDVFYFFTKTLLMDQTVNKEVVNTFDMKQVNQSSGFENKGVFILSHDNFELVRVAIVTE